MLQNSVILLENIVWINALLWLYHLGKVSYGIILFYFLSEICLWKKKNIIMQIANMQFEIYKC
jgi:hypothetical protein